MKHISKVSNNLVLELHIPNFKKARRFYELFGFYELSYDPASGGGSDLGYLVLCRKDLLGETHINFYGDKKKVSQHAHFKEFSENTPRGYAVEITIPVSNIDEFWDSVRKRIPKRQIAQPLTLKRWGKKDFRVVDPFGFYVRFTELVDWVKTKRK